MASPRITWNKPSAAPGAMVTSQLNSSQPYPSLNERVEAPKYEPVQPTDQYRTVSYGNTYAQPVQRRQFIVGRDRQYYAPQQVYYDERPQEVRRVEVREEPQKVEYREEAKVQGNHRTINESYSNQSSCCSPGLITILGLIFFILVIVALLYGLGVFGGPIPPTNNKVAAVAPAAVAAKAPAVAAKAPVVAAKAPVVAAKAPAVAAPAAAGPKAAAPTVGTTAVTAPKVNAPTATAPTVTAPAAKTGGVAPTKTAPGVTPIA